MDKIRGSLAGGAVGDALGYAVEFWGEEQIFSKYGERGITEYELDSFTGKALISDDTQMTLFTANGAPCGRYTRSNERDPGLAKTLCYTGISGLALYAGVSLHKQKIQDRRGNYSCRSWLADVPELYSSRAPGNTCLSALSAQKNGKGFVNDYVKEPQNQSKGCGGIMRVAPVALNYKHMEMGTLDMEGAQIAAITHGHSLGYMPAAIVTHIINHIVFGEEKKTLKNIVIEARDKVAEIFRETSI
ncbi:MAG: ADP-ribosylglycohydrolase family protein [Lachnoclostridium sp.]